MKKQFLTLAATVAFLAAFGSTTVALAQQKWTYKCPRCGLIQTYSMSQGVPKCPSDGAAMFLQR